MENERLIDLLYVFKDGETTPGERSELFNGLAGNPELQDEFHELMLFHNGVVKDNIRAVPDASSKSKLFKAAGIYQSGPILSYLLRFGIFASVFILGFLANGILSDEDSNASNVTLEYATLLPENNIEAKAIEEKAKSQNDQMISYSSPVAKVKEERFIENSIVSLSKNETISEKIENEEVPVDKIPEIEIAYIAMENNNIPIGSYTYNDTDFINAATLTINEPGIIGKKKSGLLRFLSGFELSSSNITGIYLFPKRLQIASFDNTLNNFTVGISLKLDENDYLGFEAGRETYDIFIARNDELNLNKSLNLYGLKYKHEFADYEKMPTVLFFSENIIGGTNVGPFVKTRLGLIWKPETIIKLYAAIEGSALGYRYNGNYELSGKISLNYGIMLNF